MGLDYEIHLTIRNKETKMKQWVIEISYWRKAWSLCSEIQSIINEPVYKIHNDEDFYTVCHPAVLREISDLILKRIRNLNDTVWTDSVFPAISTRDTTLRNLGCILAAEEWINDQEDDDSFQLMFREYDKFDKSILDSYLSHKDSYEIVIEFINSY